MTGEREHEPHPDVAALVAAFRELGVPTYDSVSVSHARALLVDDDPMVREILGEQLKSIGYTIKLATDGLDALNQLDTGTVVDVLVTDYSMPGMNGVVLIEEARRRLPTLPAILLTGFADGALRLQLDEEQSRFTALLRKPVNEADLAERLEAVLLAASPERT